MFQICEFIDVELQEVIKSVQQTGKQGRNKFFIRSVKPNVIIVSKWDTSLLSFEWQKKLTKQDDFIATTVRYHMFPDSFITIKSSLVEKAKRKVEQSSELSTLYIK